MNKHTDWMKQQYRLGWIALAAGLIFAFSGLVLPRLVDSLPFNARIITGLGIFLLGVGIAYLVRYGAARRDPRAAGRMASEEHDERLQIIRARAGSRAYWVSTAIIYAGLMWVSFAASGSLPALSADALWYFLAAAVIIPFVVYAASLTYDQQHG
ncbi:MAG: hypothetical protein IH586_02255 [Anaerolineaceae bacterium]|nr:hypothetical protein [Anaerolineaceae bacterium]